MPYCIGVVDDFESFESSQKKAMYKLYVTETFAGRRRQVQLICWEISDFPLSNFEINTVCLIPVIAGGTNLRVSGIPIKIDSSFPSELKDALGLRDLLSAAETAVKKEKEDALSKKAQFDKAKL